MAQAGEPAVLDLAAFTALSHQKKIDWIFDLFPPAQDIRTLDREIGELTSKVNALVQDLKAKEQVSASLEAARAELELPGGTLPQVKADLEQKEKELAQAQAELKELEIAQAEAKAAEEAKRLAEENVKEKAEVKPPLKVNFGSEPEPQATMPDPINEIYAQRAVASIRAIMNTMTNAGCSTCAAMLVAKRELRNFQGGGGHGH